MGIGQEKRFVDSVEVMAEERQLEEIQPARLQRYAVEGRPVMATEHVEPLRKVEGKPIIVEGRLEEFREVEGKPVIEQAHGYTQNYTETEIAATRSSLAEAKEEQPYYIK
jgi:hypothetical protein